MRVLVVDDEVSVCSCIADFLRQEGFDVDEACDGFCALLIAKEQGASISAVVTDVNMPGMDGIEMWERVKPLVSPDCKVVFISGLARKYLSDGFKFPGEVLQKPFLFNVLIEKLSASEYSRRNRSAVAADDAKWDPKGL
jgi:two-component system cell cycle sensor histidine kinase/response regulator CckA